MEHSPRTSGDRAAKRLRMPSPAMVVALIALAVALGGTSYAAVSLPANSVGTLQLKKGAVTNTKVKAHSLTGVVFKAGTLLQGAAGPVGPTGAAGAAGAVGPAGPAGVLDTAKLSVVNGASHNVAGGAVGQFDVSCPAGSHVISGGYNSGYRWYAEYNGPISTTTWRVGLINPTASTESFQVELLCYAG
jgi:hypothetical protein